MCVILVSWYKKKADHVEMFSDEKQGIKIQTSFVL